MNAHLRLVLISALAGSSACGNASPVPAPMLGSSAVREDACLAAQGDAALTEAQAKARSASGRERSAAFVSVGHELVRIARTRTEPELYRNVDACVEHALRAAPGDPDALHLRGVVWMDAHRFAEARALARELIERDAEDVAAWGLLSDAALEQGSVEEATRAAQRMLDLKPSLLSYGRAAHLRFLVDDIAGALELYARAIAAGRHLRDREPRAWMMVEAARVFLHKGDHQGAEAGFDAALREVPGYQPALAGKQHLARRRSAADSINAGL